MVRLFTTDDGSPSFFHEEHGVSYHSRHGALTETKHIFIRSGLRHKAVLQRQISILEIGLGTGLNVLATLDFAQRRDLSLCYTAVEAFPLLPEHLQTIDYRQWLKLEAYDQLWQSIHRAASGFIALAPRFLFRRLLCRLEDLAFTPTYDLIYFDAFAPTAQPELWELCICQKMYEALKPNGVLVTYCAQGQYRRDLVAAGFEVEKIPGPPGKREMTRATKRN